MFLPQFCCRDAMIHRNGTEKQEEKHGGGKKDVSYLQSGSFPQTIKSVLKIFRDDCNLKKKIHGEGEIA